MGKEVRLLGGDIRGKEHDSLAASQGGQIPSGANCTSECAARRFFGVEELAGTKAVLHSSVPGHRAAGRPTVLDGLRMQQAVVIRGGKGCASQQEAFGDWAGNHEALVGLFPSGSAGPDVVPVAQPSGDLTSFAQPFVDQLDGRPARVNPMLGTEGSLRALALF